MLWCPSLFFVSACFMQKLAATNKNNGNDTRTAFVSHMSDWFWKKFVIK